MNTAKRMLSVFMAAPLSFAIFEAAVLTAPAEAYAAEAPTYGFSDVVGDEWFANDEVLGYATEHGIISGYNDGRFGAYDSVTRGQVAVVLHRLAGEPEAQSDPFADVDYSAYYGPAISWARSAGVINGYWDEGAQAYLSFGPNDLVTREQLATMLANYAAKVANMATETDEALLNAMPDAGDVDEWARKSVGWALDVGLMSGAVEGDASYVRPLVTAQRCALAKMASILHRDVLPHEVDTGGDDAARNSAYSKIIEEYRCVLASDYVKNENRNWADQGVLKASYPDVSIYMFPNLILEKGWKYAFVDINEDGVEELVIGSVTHTDNGGMGLPEEANHRIVDIWTYTNNKPQRVDYATERRYLILMEGGVLFRWGSNGYATGAKSYIKMKDSSSLKSIAQEESNGYSTQNQIYLLSDSANYELLGEYEWWNTPSVLGGETEYFSKYTYPDGTVQEVGFGEIPDAYRELADQYQSMQTIDWRDF